MVALPNGCGGGPGGRAGLRLWRGPPTNRRIHRIRCLGFAPLRTGCSCPGHRILLPKGRLLARSELRRRSLQGIVRRRADGGHIRQRRFRGRSIGLAGFGRGILRLLWRNCVGSRGFFLGINRMFRKYCCLGPRLAVRRSIGRARPGWLLWRVCGRAAASHQREKGRRHQQRQIGTAYPRSVVHGFKR